MDYDAYARTAVDLVNADLTDLAGLRPLVESPAWLADEATERDLAVIRRTQKRMREVFEHGSAGRDAEAVAELNALLQAFPVQPRISGHDAQSWHMHVTGRGASASAEYLAGAVWGLAVWLCEYGSSRFGVCADERCGNVYLDTSSNCCRRFCSERCATRSHVAAHRARKRAEGATSERTATATGQPDRPTRPDQPAATAPAGGSGTLTEAAPATRTVKPVPAPVPMGGARTVTMSS